jgi:hypothetical protein
MIKVAGILYVVFGAIAIIMGLLALVGGMSVASYSVTGSSTMQVLDGATALVIIASGVVTTILGAVDIILGIVGIRSSGYPEKARTVIVIGYVLAALQIIGFLINIIIAVSSGSGLDASTIGGEVGRLIIGLILPALYIVGGKRNQQALL